MIALAILILNSVFVSILATSSLKSIVPSGSSTSVKVLYDFPTVKTLVENFARS